MTNKSPDNKKIILHILKSTANPSGVASAPYFITLYLKDYKDYKNYVLPTRKFIEPKTVYSTRKPPEIFRNRNKVDIFKIIIKIKPEVIIFHHHFASPLVFTVLLFSKLLGIKTISDTDFSENQIPKRHKSFIKTARDFVKLILIHLNTFLFDKLVFQTEYGLKSLLKIKNLPESKWAIIPRGIEFNPQLPEQKENYILTVSGHWFFRKNLHTTIKVMSEVIKNKKDIKLIISGEFKGTDEGIKKRTENKITGQDYRKKIVNLIEKLNLKNNVVFTGLVYGERKKDLFKRAKVYYMPTLREAFATAFIEAMAFGTPVVAMKNSAVQYEIKDGVTGFLRNTMGGQKEAILKLLEDEQLYKKMQKNCLKEAEKYKWDEVAKKWRVLIEKVLSNKEILKR